MMYPFMTLGDGTEVAHSGILCQNGTKEVKVTSKSRSMAASVSHVAVCRVIDGKRTSDFPMMISENTPNT